MSIRTVAVLSIFAFAAGVGSGLLGNRYLGPRPDRPTAPTAPGSGEPLTGHYTDEEVGLVIVRWADRNPDEDCLRVVPNGTSAPMVTVFGALGLDPSRLVKPVVSGINHVVFLTWQISPSYNLSCMTAINDPDNEGVGYMDPERRLYGIRIFKRDQ